MQRGVIMKIREMLYIIVVGFMLMGCQNSDEVSEFNRPPLYWYKQIAKSIAQGDLDKADAYYISLNSEHIRSPIISTALMMLSHAHMEGEEYRLANYYLDEYNKRFGDYSKQEYLEFMKLKASFLGIQDVYKDQKLIIDSISTAKNYAYRYPSSTFIPLVHTMLIRLHMSQYLLNENIAALYDRTGKPAGAKIYREKNKGSLVEMADITTPEQSIVGYVFD